MWAKGTCDWCMFHVAQVLTFRSMSETFNSSCVWLWVSLVKTAFSVEQTCLKTRVVHVRKKINQSRKCHNPLLKVNLEKRSKKDKKQAEQEKKKKATVNFAKKHRDQSQTFWNTVLWTDETKITLYQRDGKNKLCRETEWTSHPKHTSLSVKCDRDNVITRDGCFWNRITCLYWRCNLCC